MAAIIAAAERRLEIYERYRTGNGKWTAFVEAFDWGPFQSIGKGKVLAKVKCESKSAAVSEARKLLAEQAGELDQKHFDRG
jgi:hypothetical protein